MSHDIVLLHARRDPSAALSVALTAPAEEGTPLSLLVQSMSRALAKQQHYESQMLQRFTGYIAGRLPPLHVASALFIVHAANAAGMFADVYYSGYTEALRREATREGKARIIAEALRELARASWSAVDAVAQYATVVAQSVSPMETANRYTESAVTGVLPAVMRERREVQVAAPQQPAPAARP